LAVVTDRASDRRPFVAGAGHAAVMPRRALTAATAWFVLVVGAACGGDPTPTGPHPSAAGPSAASPSAAPRAVSVDGPIGLAAVGGAVWTASAEGDAAVRIDPASASIGATTPVGDTPLRLAADGPTLWVSVFRAQHLVGVDTATGKVVHDVPAGGGPEGVAVGLGAVWLVRQDAGLVTRYDRAGRRLGDTPIAGTPRLVALGEAYAFVSSYGAGTLTRVDRTGGHPKTSAKLCDGLQGMAVDGDVVWVTCTSGGEVLAVDPVDLTVRGRTKVDGEPDGIQVAAGRVFVAATDGPTLVEISHDPATPTVVGSRRLGAAAPLSDDANVDLLVAGDRIWVSSVKEGKVYVVPLP
jgi:hypothetical protein